MLRCATRRRLGGLCGLLAARAALLSLGARSVRAYSTGGARASSGSAGAFRGGVPPPYAASLPTSVTFGRVEGEERGDEPMEPAVIRTDELFWLRDDARNDERVLAHLRQENAHTEAETAHLEGARASLYQELKGHVKETDATAAVPHGPYEYFRRTIAGLSYVIHCRRPRVPGAPPPSSTPQVGEEVLLDENELAKPHAFFATGAIEPSPSHRLLAYSADTSGYETYAIRFLDLATGEHLNDELLETDGALAWGADDREIYYVRFDAAHRPHQLWRHVMGTDTSTDELLYTESDSKFNLAIDRSASGQYLFATAESSETSEVHALRLTKAGESIGQAPAPVLSCVAPRRFGVLYSVEHRAGEWLILSNDRGMRNFGLLTAPEGSTISEDWRPVAAMPYDPRINLETLVALRDGIACFGRVDGLTACWIVEGLAEGKPVDQAKGVHRIQLPESASEVRPAANRDFGAASLRLAYSSMVTPPSTFEYDLGSRRLTSVKELEVPGYDPSKYRCERLFARARDGTAIPLSLVYRADKYDRSAGGNMLLYGYGSYGICMEPSFSALRLPLLDRGVAYVIAHVRGGGEMGRYWYEEQGKYLNKKNTFTDFVDCASYLQEMGLTTPSQLAINGRSAGGLLMGAVLNMAPEKFGCCIAGVPFVDVMVSMCDPSIPLTTGEWEEWGNPNSAKYYEYMLSYSPMENIRAVAYPPLLVTAGLYDPRVAYWEPTKWVARLRAARTNNAPLLLKMDLDSGHFSASDRYKYLEQMAFEYAFLLDVLKLL